MHWSVSVCGRQCNFFSSEGLKPQHVQTTGFCCCCFSVRSWYIYIYLYAQCCTKRCLSFFAAFIPLITGFQTSFILKLWWKKMLLLLLMTRWEWEILSPQNSVLWLKKRKKELNLHSDSVLIINMYIHPKIQCCEWKKTISTLTVLLITDAAFN